MSGLKGHPAHVIAGSLDQGRDSHLVARAAVTTTCSDEHTADQAIEIDCATIHSDYLNMVRSHRKLWIQRAGISLALE